MAQAHALLDGEAGQSLLNAMEAGGLKEPGFTELGFRHFTNSRASLDSVESFKGLRMRSADNPIQSTAWRSIDAVPLPLSWGETMNGAIKEDIRTLVGADFYATFMGNLK